MTFSIAARCPETGLLGGAVSSSSPAVAARCLWARAGVGVALSQNITDPMLGAVMLDLLAGGGAPTQVLEQLCQNTSHIEHRQLMLINQCDTPAVWNGAHTLGTFAHAVGEHAVCAGNLLANVAVPAAMLQAYEQATGHLADRLLAALFAAQTAGGEAGPIHSAGLMVVDTLDWPMIDLRVDWSDTPLEHLREAWGVYQPQVDDYVTRANNPTVAPSYGVPGDL